MGKMDRVKAVGSLFARSLLCFVLIACVWIVGIRYRVGGFDYQGETIVPNNSGAFTDADRLLLMASLGLLIGLAGLYRAARVATMLMVLVSLLAITAIDHGWAVYGYVDEYKGVPGYAFRPAVAAVAIGPLAFLFPVGRQGGGKALAACWAVLVVTIVLVDSQSIGANVLQLWGMIGPGYMQNVLLCLLAAEAARQARRLHRALRIDGSRWTPD
jgi:hypothetical protein